MSEKLPADPPIIPAYRYGSKSSPDEKGSTADQVRYIDARIAKEPGRFPAGRAFVEENISAFRRSRGEELQAAIDAAVNGADEYGKAELWVYISSRLARGSGRKAEARSLGKLYW